MQMQTVLAESLGMERGTPKEDTGIEGLSAIEYKEKMASAHVKRLKQEQQELESRKSELLKEQTAKETKIAELEAQRIEKQKALDAESGSALKSGLANIFGKGKYAEIERENSRLQSEIETANSERDKAQEQVIEMQTQIAQLPILAEQKALTIIEKKEAQHEFELKKIRKQHTDDLAAVQSQYSELSKAYRDLETSSNMRIERLEFEKSDLLARLKAMLEMLERRLRDAIVAVIEYSRSIFKEFTMTHRETIAEYLADAPNVQDAAHTLKVFARPHLDNRQFEKGSKELDRLTSNLPSIMKELNRTQSRGFRH